MENEEIQDNEKISASWSWPFNYIYLVYDRYYADGTFLRKRLCTIYQTKLIVECLRRIIEELTWHIFYPLVIKRIK